MQGERKVLQNSATANGNGTQFYCMEWAHAVFHIVGTFVATINFEGSLDGTNWVSLQTANLSNGAVSTTATSTGMFACPIAGITDIRARVSGYASGSVTVYVRGVDVAGGILTT